MSGTVRARFKAGVLELLEEVNLQEGKDVSVTIIETPTATDADGLRRSAGGWKGLLDADAFIEQVYEDRSRPSNRPIPRL